MKFAAALSRARPDGDASVQAGRGLASRFALVMTAADVRLRLCALSPA